MKILLEKSCSEPLRRLFLSPAFKLVKEPDEADAIIFQKHAIDYIQKTKLFKSHRHKCLVLSQTFRPNFFLPGIYTNAFHHPLSAGRIKSYGYFYYEPKKRNSYIAQYKDIEMPKKYLFSFIGSSTDRVRRKLFKHYQGITDSYSVVDSTSQYTHWDVDKGLNSDQAQKQEAYVKNIKESLFYLCPRGAGHASIRLYEVMELGVAPVIISDGWIPPKGPTWEEFAIFVKGREVNNLQAILESYEDRALEMGRKAQDAFYAYFADDKQSSMIHQLIKELLAERDPVRENIVSAIFPFIHLYRKQKQWLKTTIKDALNR